MEVEDIDTLLERYLTLVNEYTELRAALNMTQATMYQDIARANFSAERGVRYGQDFYDDRMRAMRRLAIHKGADGSSFKVDRIQDEISVTSERTTTSGQGEVGDKEPKTRDPLRWFGLLAPKALRNAQEHATRAVEQTIPRLATVASEMAEVEIRVRRARKKRSRAAAAAEKSSHDRERGDVELAA